MLWPNAARAACAFTFDLDAETLWMARGVTEPVTLSQGRFGPVEAMPRILQLLKVHAVHASFFIPAWVAEQYPDTVRTIAGEGHEIGCHGDVHERVSELPVEREEEILLKSLEVLTPLAGRRPIGYRAPSWDMNFRTPGLLARYGFRYDSGLMDSDHPYRLATEPGPGAATLIELPCHWSLDDWNRYNYIPGLTGTGVIGRPSQVTAAWAEELDAIVEVGGLFSLTMHPFVSGRPARAAALEQLIERAAAIDGLWLAAGDEIAAWVEGLDLPPVHHERPVVHG
jgi:peptidoglycan/xylan/chitin deacetylase (PgdA/CDA1 family)